MSLPAEPQTKVVLSGEISSDAPIGQIPVKPLANVQATIAYALLWIFALTILASIVLVGADIISAADAKDFVTPFITAEVGLLGAVTGFYFATREQRQGDHASNGS
jgi:hypothetical protein